MSRATHKTERKETLQSTSPSQLYKFKPPVRECSATRRYNVVLEKFYPRVVLQTKDSERFSFDSFESKG